MDNKNKTIIILSILTIIFMIMGGTLAYFNWQSSSEQNTAVTFTVASGFSCSADGGGSINNNSGTLAPASCTNSTYAFQRTIKANVINNRGANIYLDMWLNVNSIDSGLANSSNFKYALTTDPESCTTDVVSEGTFKGTKANDKVYILEGKSYPVTTNNDTFYLYVWLDAAETSSSTQNQNFSLTLGGSCSDNYTPKPNKPVLDTGMIPVKISDTGVVTAVSEDDDTWYDYSSKQWANAVLVKEEGVKTRSANKNDLTTIKNNVKEVATGNDQWYTHPAFTFGDKELDGIWVGKFETTGSSSIPTILPNKNSITSDDSNLSNEFKIALKFAGGSMTNNVISFIGSTYYGLTSSTDSHMMKNSEWGAVVYLSHSKYGINTKIRMNNYLKMFRIDYFFTGCGADAAHANTYDSVTTCAIPYGTVSGETYTYPQSTTGNISGIFDMSGGAYDAVMGNLGNAIGSSGFSDTWFTTTGNSKYYDLYDSSIFTGTNSTNMTFCTLATCGGHALNETNKWYSNSPSSAFVYSRAPWFSRGGTSSGTTYNGFSVNTTSGGSVDHSFHTILANVGN